MNDAPTPAPKIEILDPLAIPAWDDLLRAHPDAHVFHSAAWARVLVDAYGYKPVYFASRDGDRILALLAVMDARSPFTGRRGVALPFSDLCAPLCADAAAFEALRAAALEYGIAARWKYLEWRDGAGHFESTLPFARFYVHKLRLAGDEQSLLASFRSSTRRNIQKAVKDGVTTSVGDSADALREFYALNCLTRRDHGLPPQPYRFFEMLHRHMLACGKGAIVLAHHDGRTIAGNLYLHFGDQAMYKYGASDRKYQHLRASNLVMWEAVKWYAARAFRTLHMGRTEPENEGLLQFKRGWGCEEETIRYHRYNFSRRSYQGSSAGFGLSTRIIRRLPIPALKLAGQLLYRHMA